MKTNKTMWYKSYEKREVRKDKAEARGLSVVLSPQLPASILQLPNLLPRNLAFPPFETKLLLTVLVNSDIAMQSLPTSLYIAKSLPPSFKHYISDSQTAGRGRNFGAWGIKKKPQLNFFLLRTNFFLTHRTPQGAQKQGNPKFRCWIYDYWLASKWQSSYTLLVGREKFSAFGNRCTRWALKKVWGAWGTN